MDKSKELEIIAKYNLDNKTNFYKMDQVLDHIYKNTKSKDNVLSRIAAGQIAQTEGPGATIGQDIASGKVDNVQEVLTKYGISPEDAKQYSLNTAKDKDTKSTKQAAGITTTAMMTSLPILDIAKYGWISGLGRNVAGAVGGAVGGYYGNKADKALNTNFLGITGGLLGGGLGYGAASFRPVSRAVKIMGLQESGYSGVPHRRDWRTGLWMDENFPNYEGTVWTTTNKDYARGFANGLSLNRNPELYGNIYKVFVPKKLKTVEVPSIKNTAVEWVDMPYERVGSEFKFRNPVTVESRTYRPKDVKSIAEGGDRKNYPKMTIVGSPSTKIQKATDDIVEEAFDMGNQRMRMKNVFDGPLYDENFKSYTVPIDEEVIAAGVPRYSILGDGSKWSLFFNPNLLK